MGNVQKYSKQIYKGKKAKKVKNNTDEFKYHSKKKLRKISSGLYTEIADYDIDFVRLKILELSISKDIKKFVKDGIFEHLEREDIIFRVRKKYPTYLMNMKSKIGEAEYDEFISIKNAILDAMDEILKDNRYEHENIEILKSPAYEIGFIIQNNFRIAEMKHVSINHIDPKLRIDEVGFEKIKKN